MQNSAKRARSWAFSDPLPESCDPAGSSRDRFPRRRVVVGDRRGEHKVVLSVGACIRRMESGVGLLRRVVARRRRVVDGVPVTLVRSVRPGKGTPVSAAKPNEARSEPLAPTCSRRVRSGSPVAAAAPSSPARCSNSAAATWFPDTDSRTPRSWDSSPPRVDCPPALYSLQKKTRQEASEASRGEDRGLTFGAAGRVLTLTLIGADDADGRREGSRRRLLRLPLPRLNAVLPHRQRPVHPVQLEVKSASVADGLSLVISAPQGGRPRPAVGAAQSETFRRRLRGKLENRQSPTRNPPGSRSTDQSFGRFYQGSVHAVHFMVETARVAQVVTGSVSAPQRRGYGTAVDAFSPFAELELHAVI